MNRIHESNEWTESMNRIHEANQWIESMNLINEFNQWTQSMNRIHKSNHEDDHGHEYELHNEHGCRASQSKRCGRGAPCTQARLRTWTPNPPLSLFRLLLSNDFWSTGSWGYVLLGLLTEVVAICVFWCWRGFGLPVRSLTCSRRIRKPIPI